MQYLAFNFSFKQRLLASCLFMISCLTAVSFLSLLIWPETKVHAQAQTTKTSDNTAYNNSPNIITRGLFSSANGLHNAADSAASGVNSALLATRQAVVDGTVHGVVAVAHGAVASASITAGAVGKSAEFLGHSAAKTISLADNITKLGSLITPAASNQTPVPTISETHPTVSEKPVTQIPLSDFQQPAKPQTVITPQWPIHGMITLGFGVPHWPFQPIHTGIDISDGMPQGVTPIHPFEPGIVVEVIQSNYGFGNHVIVDHGGGLRSLYGHMYATSAQVGEHVDQNSVLGYEGTTGASTGVHVHFEIDINGQPVDPRNYVSGLPA